jgi:hypothetical protein
MRFGRSAAHTLRCRDAGRHALRLAVAPHVDRCGPRVSLAVEGIELLLTPLQVGRLRAELRDCVLAADAQYLQQFEQGSVVDCEATA